MGVQRDLPDASLMHIGMCVWLPNEYIAVGQILLIALQLRYYFLLLTAFQPVVTVIQISPRKGRHLNVVWHAHPSQSAVTAIQRVVMD